MSSGEVFVVHSGPPRLRSDTTAEDSEVDANLSLRSGPAYVDYIHFAYAEIPLLGACTATQPPEIQVEESAH